MVTLSVTPSRIASVLLRAADNLHDWHPLDRPLMRAIDEAAGYVPGKGGRDAEETTLQAFDALSTYLRCPAGIWERIPGTTPADVIDAMRYAAKAVTA